MYAHYTKQISKYRDFFPKNTPKDALGKTIFMLRMVHKNPVYKENYPNLPESYSGELKRIMIQACETRYETLMEFHAPLDENSVDHVAESLIKLTVALSGDLEMDDRYFGESFSRLDYKLMGYFREFKIVELNADMYVQLLSGTVDSYIEKVQEFGATQYSSIVFQLHSTLRKFDYTHASTLSS